MQKTNKQINPPKKAKTKIKNKKPQNTKTKNKEQRRLISNAQVKNVLVKYVKWKEIYRIIKYVYH